MGGAGKRVGVTGAGGLLGHHARCWLQAHAGYQPRAAFRADFADREALAEFSEGLDALYHFAGMNRGEDAEILAVNVGLAEQLVEALETSGARPHLLFASSTHRDRDSAYGRSKREAARVLREAGARLGFAYTEVVLPNVYGEGGRPDYNSAVSTFCDRLANGGEPQVNPEGSTELVHAQQVAAFFAASLATPAPEGVRMEGRTLSIPELWERLQRMHASYLAMRVPDLRDPLDLGLFNTLRTALYPRHYPVALQLHEDPRGSLFEAVKADQGGQVFLSRTRPGITRGNHYHLHKVERFLVVGGAGTVRIRPLFGDTVQEFRLDGARPAYVDMPTLHTHSIENEGDAEMLTLFWAHEIFDPAAPDTYPEDVLK